MPNIRTARTSRRRAMVARRAGNDSARPAMGATASNYCRSGANRKTPPLPTLEQEIILLFYFFFTK